jgi:hypothetical protein
VLAVAMLIARVAAADDATPAPPTTPRAVLAAALERFDNADYEAVVTLLRPMVASDGAGLPSVADRVEAFRAYGIACLLTSTTRRSEAEEAFRRLLRADPSARLDATLVRPEAVALFDEVRAAVRIEALAEYKRTHRRRYVVLDFLPPVGQFMNGQRAKGFAIGTAELALLALNVTTGTLLQKWQGDDKTFPGHVDDFRKLQPVNIASFAVLLSVIVYGIVDGLVVNHRLDVEERRFEQRLLRAHLRRDGGLALTF